MSRKKAIDDMCKMCIYDPHASGAWRMQVEACTSVHCPLYDFRPKSAKRRKNTRKSHVKTGANNAA